MSVRWGERGTLVRVTGAVAVVIAVAAGCTNTAPQSPTPTATATAEVEGEEEPAPSSPSATNHAVPEERTEADPSPQPPAHPDPTDSGAPLPTWDPATQDRAEAQALAFVRAFLRTDLPRDDWYVGIRGFLSEDAQEKYTTVNPRNVPNAEVTGEAVLVDSSSAFLAGVEVPTAAGVFAVTLSRSEVGESWVVEGAELLP